MDDLLAQVQYMVVRHHRVDVYGPLDSLFSDMDLTKHLATQRKALFVIDFCYESNHATAES
jgi:hypothetical protein